MRKIDVYIQAGILTGIVLTLMVMWLMSPELLVVLLCLLFLLGTWQLGSAIVNTIIELKSNTDLSPELAVYWMAVLCYGLACISITVTDIHMLYLLLSLMISVYYLLINVKRIQHTRNFLQL